MFNLSMWCGTEDSFNSYLAFLRYKDNHSVIAEGIQAFYDDEEEEDFASTVGRELITVDGNVGVINISGTLVADFSYYNRWFDLVSYQEITNAVRIAAEMSEVDKILLNIDSGGGDVKGLDEAANYIAEIDKNHKPVYAHTGSIMASGAYWLAASARNIQAGKISISGSIGVLMVHQSYARLLKERGIDVKVFRAGKYKALGHPAEKLSDIAINEIQSRINETYNHFLNHVSSNRNVKLNEKDKWAEGRVFGSADAFELNLIDGVNYLSQTIEKLNHTDDNLYQRLSVSETNSQGSDDMSKTTQKVVKTEAELAAIQSGANIPTEEVEVEKPETSVAEASVSDPDIPKEEANPEKDSPEVKEPQTVITGVDPTVYAEVVGQKAVLEKDVETLTAQLEASTNDNSLLVGIAIKATNRLQIALNQSPTALEGLPASVVLQTYSETEAKFNDTFKVGVSSKPVVTKADQPEGAEQAGIYPLK